MLPKLKTIGKPTYHAAGCALLGVRLAKCFLKVGAGIAADFVEAGPTQVIGKTIGNLWLHTGAKRKETSLRKLLKRLRFSKSTAAVDPDHEAPFVNHLEGNSAPRPRP
jgi:hypothetical protein